MKFHKVFTIICAFLLFIPLLHVHADLPLTEEQKAVLQIIHQLSWSAQKIYTYNDIVALNEEKYTLSSDSLDLSIFKNDTKYDKLYNTVKDLRDLILKFQIEEEDRKMLEEFRKDEIMINVIENANIFKGVNTTAKHIIGDPYTELAGMGFKLLVNTSNSISNYLLLQKKYSLEQKRKKYEFDKKKKELLHKSIQAFDENIKDAIVEKLLKDKYMRVPLEHIEALVEEVKKANLQSIPLGDSYNNETKSLQKFLKESQQYYNYFQMYWYYRGVCEEKLGNDEVAIEAYKRYQELDAGLIKWNKTAASVAMNIIKLLMHKDGNYREEIYSQLQIIDDNTNIYKEDWNLSYFAGLVYLYKYGDILQAKRELGKAEEKLSRAYFEEWKKFRVKLREEKELSIPASNPKDKRNICGNAEFLENLETSIPAGHKLYLCRLALNNAKISEATEKVVENKNLMNELYALVMDETTSIFEGLNYWGSTSYDAIIEKYIKDIASIRICLEENTFSTDELIAILPFKCFILTEIYPTMHFLTYNKITDKYEQSKEQIIYDQREERILTKGQKVKLYFRKNIKEIKKSNISHIMLKIPFDDNQSISVLFDINDLFNDTIKNPFMFARRFIYNNKIYYLSGNIVATDIDDTFEEDTGWNPIQEFKGWRVQSSGNEIRIIDKLDRVRLEFSNTDGKAIAIKDKLWEDICNQLKNSDYWKEWVKNNPPK